MKVINFVFCGIFVAMYIAGWLFPKFRRYIKKNIWLDNLPGVLELIFFIKSLRISFCRAMELGIWRGSFLACSCSYRFGNFLLVG